MGHSSNVMPKATQQCAIGSVVCLITGSGLNDGQWHSVELNSGPDHLSITLDKDEGATAHTSFPLPLTTDTQLFFGGELV